MAEQHSPLTQFEIKRLVEIDIAGLDVSFTNSSLMMVIVLVLVTALLTLSMRGRAMVPGRWQSIAELSYEFIANMLRENVGSQGRQYFPFVFTLFMFIVTSNLLGLLPYSFTVTSHIVITFAMAIVVFLGVTVIGLIKHKLHFFSFFVPKGVPMALIPILVPIEVISYLARPVSLSLRLFANMMAGHTLLKVFGGFVVVLGIFGVAPLLFVVALYALELIVAVLQAYVFTIL
ncbi:MAG: F0F1 ATP synthase subunit A, partial [Alphaproteobacteria bacterium]|nr:F0F1 ATP synthase subunit A [Alphaproteobacteria bacterium]